ncbi:UNVERIFIED_CONTAM: E3 binding domain-containing protein, partial [Salmonella enterica subsp. enterica serovar Enteritidis]
SSAPLGAAIASPVAAVAEALPVAAAAAADGVRATPLARRIARESGIDLTSVAGSGPKGRIQRRDVEANVPQARPAAAQPAVTVPVQAKTGDAPLHAVWLRQGNDATLAPLVLIH